MPGGISMQITSCLYSAVYIRHFMLHNYHWFYGLAWCVATIVGVYGTLGRNMFYVCVQALFTWSIYLLAYSIQTDCG